MNARQWFTSALLGLVALALAPIVTQWSCARTQTPHSARSVCRSKLHVLADALEKYAARHDGRYPTELWQLTQRDADGVFCLATIPRDPWQARYVYVSPAAPGAKPVVSSNGIDGIAGTPDDLLAEADE